MVSFEPHRVHSISIVTSSPFYRWRNRCLDYARCLKPHIRNDGARTWPQIFYFEPFQCFAVTVTKHFCFSTKQDIFSFLILLFRAMPAYVQEWQSCWRDFFFFRLKYSNLDVNVVVVVYFKVAVSWYLFPLFLEFSLSRNASFREYLGNCLKC